MEALNLGLGKYKAYLDQKNQEYQNILNQELEIYKTKLKDEQKKHFEQSSKELLNKMQGMKDTYFKSYAEAMEKTDATPDGEIKERRKKMAEQRLNEFLDTCRILINNYFQGIEV